MSKYEATLCNITRVEYSDQMPYDGNMDMWSTVIAEGDVRVDTLVLIYTLI